LTPEWEKAASNLKGLVRVGAINCDEEKEFCGGFGIQGFPTIKIFPAGQGASKKPVDYQQARTAAAIVKTALSHLPNYSTTLTTANSEKFLAK
jgi:protein disulfide-isomerase A6